MDLIARIVEDLKRELTEVNVVIRNLTSLTKKRGKKRGAY